MNQRGYTTVPVMILLFVVAIIGMYYTFQVYTGAYVPAENSAQDFGSGIKVIGGNQDHVVMFAQDVVNQYGTPAQAGIGVHGFSATPTSGAAPLNVNFDYLAPGFGFYSVDYGDGSSDALSFPAPDASGSVGPGHYTHSHTYAAAGNYTAKLSVRPGSQPVGHPYVRTVLGSVTITVSAPSGTPSDISVPGMSKYTDADFGFSFWYPSGWTVNNNVADYEGSAPPGTHLGDGIVTSQFDVSNGRQHIIVNKINSDARSVHVGNDYYGYDTFYFDTTNHTWMDSITQAANGSPDRTVAADVSNNTMGGLHIFSGGLRFGASSLIPLSAHHFLRVTTSDFNGVSQIPLVRTILATDPSVATPVSTAEQIATIQAEAKAYGVSQTGALKTFSDDELGFSLEYPASLMPKPDQNVWGGLSNKLAQNPFTVRSGPVALMVTVSPDPSAVGSCAVTPQPSEQSVSGASTVMINGVPFHSYTIGDAATGHFTTIHIYKAIKNNACYQINEQINTDRVGSDAESIAQDKSVNEGKAQIEPIIQSFAFTRDMSSAAPPSCTLKTDKFEYKLGDIITLTWKSVAATRAVWDQDPVQGTGIRNKIIPPQGIPAPSGTGATIANIEGFQHITMNVAGDGGYGTCSTDVQVDHSDKKPSITIDSVRFTGAGAKYTNEKYVDVTLSGTATFGGLFNDEVNIVLYDPSYQGPFDKNSIYSDAFADRKYFYSGGTQPGVREDNLQFKKWTAETFVPRGVTKVRVLVYGFFYGPHSSLEPIVNKILDIQQ